MSTVKQLKQVYLPADKNCHPIHPVQDWLKVRNIIRALRRGETLPPIMVWGSRAMQLSGVHRSAANYILEALGDDRRIAVVDFDDLSLSPELDEAIIDAAESEDFETLDRLCDQAVIPC
jgi:hypothetical protein